MTVNIGIINKNGAVLGADRRLSKRNTSTGSCKKTFEVEGKNPMIVTFNGSVSALKYFEKYKKTEKVKILNGKEVIEGFVKFILNEIMKEKEIKRIYGMVINKLKACESPRMLSEQKKRLEESYKAFFRDLELLKKSVENNSLSIEEFIKISKQNEPKEETVRVPEDEKKNIWNKELKSLRDEYLKNTDNNKSSINNYKEKHIKVIKSISNSFKEKELLLQEKVVFDLFCEVVFLNIIEENSFGIILLEKVEKIFILYTYYVKKGDIEGFKHEKLKIIKNKNEVLIEPFATPFTIKKFLQNLKTDEQINVEKYFPFLERIERGGGEILENFNVEELGKVAKELIKLTSKEYPDTVSEESDVFLLQRE